MKKYLSIIITVTITQLLFSVDQGYELPDYIKEKQEAIEKIETHKRVEKEAMERTALRQNAKHQIENRLKAQAMEAMDIGIERKNENEKSRHINMVTKFKNKVGSSGNKWQDPNDSLRGECGDGFCDDLEGEDVDTCPEDCDGYNDVPPACFWDCPGFDVENAFVCDEMGGDDTSSECMVDACAYLIQWDDGCANDCTESDLCDVPLDFLEPACNACIIANDCAEYEEWVGSMPGFNEWLTECGNDDTIEILINGQDSLSITQGTDITITVQFAEGSNSALLETGYDMDGDNIWDENADQIISVSDADDFFIMNVLLTDNDQMDENMESGVYEFTLQTDFWNGNEDIIEDGNGSFLNLYQYFRGFFIISNGESQDAVYYEQVPVPTEYSVSGSTNPPSPNLSLVTGSDDLWAFTLTDVDGNYTFYYNEPDEYIVFYWDIFFTNFSGYFSDPIVYEVDVDGEETGYDFNITLGDASIVGYVNDQYGNPAEGIMVRGESDLEVDGPDLMTHAVTDSSGYYNMSVLGGRCWEIRVEGSNSSNYMIGNYDDEIYVCVDIDGTAEAEDLMVYATDSYISGTVYLDEMPLTGTYNLEVRAWTNDIGENETNVLEDGTYELPVASEADNINNGYQIDLNYWNGNNNNFGLPENVYLEEEYYNNIQSGSDGIDFNFITIYGGIEGYITDESGNPLDDMSINIWGSTVDNNNFYSWTQSNSDGYYKLYIPPGWYDINIYPDYDSDIYYCSSSFNDIEIQDELINQDFTIDVFTSNNIISGHVYDFETGLPISGIYVNLDFQTNDDCNLNVYIDTDTDENGYYEFINIPSHIDWGGINVYDNDYLGNYINIDGDHEGETIYDFNLRELTSSISGNIYDATTGEMLDEVSVQVYEMDENGNYNTYINSDWINYGYYSIDLPDGCFEVEFEKYCCDEISYIDLYHAFCVTSQDYTYEAYMQPSIILGDVNGDGGLNILDVVTLVDIIMSNENYIAAGDINGDGYLNIMDIVQLVNLILEF